MLLGSHVSICLLYTSDAADDMQCVDLGGRRIIKKIEQIIGLLKNQSSKESNVKIHRLAYITNSKFDGNNYIDRWCKIRNSHIGEYSYIGFGSDFNNVEVGRYCSISSDVKIGLGKHPTHFFSSSPIFYSNNNPFNIKQKFIDFNDQPSRTTIKNDVWIGANVIIMDGLTINTGACLLYTSPSPRDYAASRMPSSA
ncbi:hypothetical protein JMUB7515_27780 [Staphylococcus aureus]